MTYSRLMQEARDNWPEDEALRFYNDWVRPDDEGNVFPASAIADQRAHMHQVFDDPELIARFEAEVTRLTNH